jgi:hypothetical protein
MEPLIFKNADGVFEFSFQQGRRGAFTKEETLIISDWDDTLTITHILVGEYARYASMIEECPEIPKELQAIFDILANAVKGFLTEAQKYGRVLIVTNASEGWVEVCCKRFMPSILSLVTSFTIISARDYYEAESPYPHIWKQYAFRDILLTHFLKTPNIRKNIISVGDGTAEQHAMRSLKASCFEKTNINLITTKTIRIMGMVKEAIMERQLKFITDSFDNIVNYTLPIDVDVGFDIFVPFKSMPRISTDFRLAPFEYTTSIKGGLDVEGKKEEEPLCELGMEIFCECKKCGNKWI